MKRNVSSFSTFSLLLLITLHFNSCSSDSIEPSDEGKIIDNWNESFVTPENVDGSFNDSLTTYPCEGIILRVRENGTMNMQIFKRIGPDQCSTLENDWLHEGRWKRLEKEKYRFVLTSEDGQRDSIIEPEYIRFPKENLMEIQFDAAIDNEVDTPFYLEHTFFREE